MANGHVLRSELANSLSLFWKRVERLSSDQVDVILRTFAEEHVKRDFRKKFVKTFDSEKAISERFFIKSKRVIIEEHLTKLFRITGKSITTKILWDTSSDPVAFKLEGPPRTVDKLFVMEGDALALVTWQGGEAYLFLDGHKGNLWAFSPNS